MLRKGRRWNMEANVGSDTSNPGGVRVLLVSRAALHIVTLLDIDHESGEPAISILRRLFG